MHHPPSTDPLATLERAAAPADSPLPLPRLLLVFAHPDDEVLAMGARFERLASSKLLTLTDGTPRDGADAHHHGFASLDAYRVARQAELDCALRDAGLTQAVVGTAPNVPVPDQAAALHLPELIAAVTQAIRTFQSEAVLTHPYEGGHPDHDACAFAVHTAVAHTSPEQGKSSRNAPIPIILEAPFYHAGENASIRTGTFLDHPKSPATLVCELSPEQRATKRRRLTCFPSQAETLAQFEISRELFRIAPFYDFTQPPHPGQLFYERFSWGMTGQRFRELAALALTAGTAPTPDTNTFPA